MPYPETSLKDAQEEAFQLLCNFYSDGNAEVLTLDSANFKVIQRTAYPRLARMTSLNQAYLLSDASLILFGATRSSRSPYMPAVFLYAPDGSLNAKYEFEGKQNEGWIADAVPSEVPDEFATIRQIRPDNKDGVARTAMAFLQRKYGNH